MAPVNLAQFLRESIQMLKHVLPSSIEVAIDASPTDELWIDADMIQLNQILMNLAVNARDAMPEGGSLRICARSRLLDTADSWPAITARDRGAVELLVADTGCGMSREVLTRVCDPFFTTKPREQGTGLGMSVVAGIVKAHNGQMLIESEVGSGTCTTIAFPRRLPPEGGPATRSDQSAAHQLQARVLLADDNLDLRIVMATALEAAGCTVLHAADGAQVIELYEGGEDNIDVAILDIDMPKLSGTDCLLRMHRTQPDLPVILISGAVDPATWTEASQMVSSLAKPFIPDDLVEAVAAILKQRRREQIESD